jgi:hypothetical protein
VWTSSKADSLGGASASHGKSADGRLYKVANDGRMKTSVKRVPAVEKSVDSTAVTADRADHDIGNEIPVR